MTLGNVISFAFYTKAVSSHNNENIRQERHVRARVRVCMRIFSKIQRKDNARPSEILS